MNNQITAAAESPAPVGTAEPMKLGAIVARLSGHLDPDKHGTGTLAELRRIDEHDDLPAAFWRFYLEIVPEEWREPDGFVNKTIDHAWADLTRAMIEMAPRPHSFDMPFGTALAGTDYSEARFIRLVRARRDGDLPRELRVAAAWLSRANVKANWEQPAHLMLGGISPRYHTQHPHSVRHRIARDYFREAAKRQSPEQRGDRT